MEERRQPTFDGEIVADATVEELNRPLLVRLLSRERAASPFVFGTLDDESALLSLNVLNYLALYRDGRQQRMDDLNATDQSVRAALKQGAGSARDIAQLLNRPYVSVARSLKRLSEGGYVKRANRNGRGFLYELP